MRNVVYKTDTKDSWAADVDDLMFSLRTFWMPYQFELEFHEGDVMEIVVVDDRYEADFEAESAFQQICGLIILSIQMWIEGHTVGRYK